MKYIITNKDNALWGPFSSIEKLDNGYLADGISYQTLATGEVTITEVSDDYKVPEFEIKPVVKTPTLEDLQAQIDALKQGA